MNTVEVVFPDHVHTADALSPLWQWDYGQRLIISGLQLPASYEVHFCNAGDEGTKSKIGDANGVAIPDEYLRDGRNIHAFIYLHAGETDGETVYMIKIRVKPRPRPTDLFPSEEQETALDYAIKRLTEFADATREVDTEPIRGSANLVTSGGVYAALDGLDDALSGKQDTLTFDQAPTAGSGNPVSSGGVYDALQAVSIPVDDELSGESENPVQNKVIYSALNALLTRVQRLEDLLREHIDGISLDENDSLVLDGVEVDEDGYIVFGQDSGVEVDEDGYIVLDGHNITE